MAFLDLNYFSQALQKMQRAKLIIPEGVNPPYHVLIQLHGLSDDESAWTRRTSIERYVDGLPLLVAMPDGGRGFYCDALQGYAYGTAIGMELPKLLDRWFDLKPGWAIGGLSMGGYGCFRLALSHPERFVSAASHSGALHFGHYPPREDDFGREFQRVTGDDPAGGPNDLYSLSKSVNPRPKLKFDCGVDDFLIDANRDFHTHLEEIGYEHEYAEFPGDHNWAYWDEHFQEALAFHRENLKF
jgi:S-formylglutathione hydrolase FrmB